MVLVTEGWEEEKVLWSSFCVPNFHFILLLLNCDQMASYSLQRNKKWTWSMDTYQVTHNIRYYIILNIGT